MFEEDGEHGADLPLESVGDAELREQLAQRHTPKIPVPLPVEEEPATTDGEFQFPLLSIFLLMLFAAVAFSMGRIFSYPLVAGVLGMVVLFWQVALMFFEPRIPALHLSWWGALLIYLMVAGMAVFR